MGLALVCVRRRGLRGSIFCLSRPDGVKRMDGRGFHGWWGWLPSSAWVDGMGRRGLRCGIDLGVLERAGA